MVPELKMRLKNTEKKQKLTQIIKNYQNSTFKSKNKVLEELETVSLYTKSEEYELQHEIWAKDDALLEKRDFDILYEEPRSLNIKGNNLTDQILMIPRT